MKKITLILSAISFVAIVLSTCKKDDSALTFLSGDTITDIDGNEYKTVIIGTQIWMAENLRTNHYIDGSPIPNVTDNSEWTDLTTGAYCWYNNDSATYSSTYGALYNKFAVLDSRNLCPSGWHVPTDEEWTTLTTYLGGESVAGGKLKEKGTTHWNSPNTGANNITGFTALPGSIRIFDGTYDIIGYGGLWCSSSEYDGGVYEMWGRYIYSWSNMVERSDYGGRNGASVRCIKD
jgi:uncharacterized protein (TIGR02145 family)